MLILNTYMFLIDRNRKDKKQVGNFINKFTR